jgi:hypothetical protein
MEVREMASRVVKCLLTLEVMYTLHVNAGGGDGNMGV